MQILKNCLPLCASVFWLLEPTTRAYAAHVSVARDTDPAQGQWPASKAMEWYNRKPWLVGCNFLPSSAVNDVEMWQKDTFDPETIDRELAWAPELGFNSVRVFLNFVVWQDDPAGFKKCFDQFLGIAYKRRLQVMPVLFDDWNFAGREAHAGPQPNPEPITGVHPAFLWLASLGFIINWFGDSLDGTLARYRHIVRPRFGFYIDHTIDAFSEVLIVLGIGISPLVRFDLACLAVVGYLLLSNIVFINTCVLGEFRISYGKLGPTEVRVILILTNMIVYFSGNPILTTQGAPLTVFDWIVIAITGLLLFFSIQSAVINGRALARQGE